MAYADPTTNYSWDLPAEGGDTNDWGRLLNEIFGNETTGLDPIIKAVSDVADAALPLAGGTVTGTVLLGTNGRITETVKNVSASEVDLAVGNFFRKTISGITTFTFANPPASGTAQAFTLELINGSSATVNWPGTVEWQDATAPTLSANKDVLVFYTRDGGTTYVGTQALADVS